MNYLGDFAEDATVDFKWSSNDTDGASITRGTDGTISVYIGNSITQLTAGITDTEDFDGVTGIHHCRIDLSASASYVPGSECQVVITGASIDGITVNAVLAHFSIERAGGVLALLKGANGLSAIKTETASIQSDTNDIQTRLPAALVSGRMDASIGETQTGAITAGGIAPDAIGASELAADAVAEIAAGVRTELTTELGRIDVATSTRASQASVDTIDDFLDTEIAAIKATTDKLDQTLDNSSDGWIFTVAALQNAPAGGGGLTAADVWAHGTRTLTAIDEDSTTLDLDNTIRGAVGLASANLDTQLDALPTAAENADAVWDETLSTVLHATPGSAGYNMQIAGQILVDTTATGTPSTTQVQLSAGSAIDDFYNDQLLYIADGTGIGQVRPILDYAGATKTVTVSEAFAVTPASGDRVIVQTAHVHPTSQIADAVWATSSRTITGLASNSLTAAALAADAAAEIASAVRTELTTELGRVDVAVSTRASAADLATVAGYIDTEVAAVKAVTDKIDTMIEATSDGYHWNAVAVDEIPFAVWAWNARTLTAFDEDSTSIDLDATIRGAVGLAAANLDTQLDALPTAAENSTAVWGAGTRSLTVFDEDSTTIDIDATVRAAVGLASANLDTQLAAIDDAVDTEVAAIKATTDKLDSMVENTSDGWIFTVDSLQNAPTGGSAPTASQIADEVQTRTIAAVTTVNGLANNSVTAAALATDAVAEIQAGLATDSALATVDTVVDAIKATTDKLDSMVENTSDGWIWTIAALQNAPGGAGGLTAADVWAHATRTLTAIDEDSTTLDLDATIRGAVGLASANLDTQLDALPTASENAAAVWGAGARTLTALDEDTTTIDLDATIRGAVGLASANLDTQLDAVPTAVENADALLDRNMAAGVDNGSSTVRTPRQALRILRNKWSINSDGLQTINKEDDVTPSWAQQLSTDAGAQPVTGTDPAGP